VRSEKRDYQKLLIVEGVDDKHSVIGLMKDHTEWPEEPEKWPVWVKVGRSVDEILTTGYLSGEVKASRVTTIGVMLDADINPDGRYQRIQQLLSLLFPALPVTMPIEGLVLANDDDKRLGVWLMPDNQTIGDLETFLRYLVPDAQKALWELACENVSNARQHGAPCRDTHVPKANLYTWLSWQDPPGQSPGRALTKKILDPQSPYADAFVAWFKRLYQLS
jgi:hypothetical protein